MHARRATRSSASTSGCRRTSRWLRICARKNSPFSSGAVGSDRLVDAWRRSGERGEASAPGVHLFPACPARLLVQRECKARQPPPEGLVARLEDGRHKELPTRLQPARRKGSVANRPDADQSRKDAAHSERRERVSAIRTTGGTLPRGTPSRDQPPHPLAPPPALAALAAGGRGLRLRLNRVRAEPLARRLEHEDGREPVGGRREPDQASCEWRLARGLQAAAVGGGLEDEHEEGLILRCIVPCLHKGRRMQSRRLQHSRVSRAR